ncbi:hypothetical protein [Pontibacter fetidus]|uniref:Uncharacterized protein n=1 Tax=Pontibacter fetidus TaxID=2700082 RepID=A0A6B2H6E5_9BACT|nr:hypothetical protein [Pontibacter fetidus]NDK54772.1 hypothetical protein [Pontibacter fetidus]
MVTYKDFKSDNEGEAYMLRKYLDPISYFTPLLVSSRSNNLGATSNYVVAFRKASKEDWNLFHLRQDLGKTHSEYITAFNEYRAETYRSWEIIGGLEVHHKYYKVGLKPWEYPNDALTTLCWCCHNELHQNSKVPVLDEYDNEIGEYTNCSRCNGVGHFPEFSHIQGGICFQCDGARYKELVV